MTPERYTLVVIWGVIKGLRPHAADPNRVIGAPIWAHMGPKYIIFWVTMDLVIQPYNKLCHYYPGVQNFNTDLLVSMDLEKQQLF